MIVFALLFMASQWQLEIADLCIENGWQFKFFFNLIVFSDAWAVRDFWLLMLDLCFIGCAVCMFDLGRYIRDAENTGPPKR
jgi:hypothetical protein